MLRYLPAICPNSRFSGTMTVFPLDHCHTEGETKVWSDNTSCIAGIRSTTRCDFAT